jgi:hypothetical protein
MPVLAAAGLACNLLHFDSAGTVPARQSQNREEIKMDFSHSTHGMSELTKRILARRLRRELLRRNQGLHRELKAIDDETLLRQFFLQGFVERERIASEALLLRERATNSVAVGGTIVALKTAGQWLRTH